MDQRAYCVVTNIHAQTDFSWPEKLATFKLEKNKSNHEKHQLPQFELVNIEIMLQKHIIKSN